MKLASILFAAAMAFAKAQDATTGVVTAASVAPSTAPGAGASTAPGGVAGSAATSATAGANPLDALKPTVHKGEFHMAPVRVVHARVQSDAPMLVQGRFVSSFGKGDLKAGYLSAMDNVNTASVEGALMYVQAEGINIKSRSEQDRCVRKNKMQHIVFYEILFAQTNETIAQFEDRWEAHMEYGPMIPMDTGACTPLKGDSEFPAECLQFNGENGQPNVGPFVGGENKEQDVRAPYPGNYWFSFPNTCPLAKWPQKNDTCRAATRKGLCDIDKAPDGVECTFAYNILGWVPIDDVVGITSLTNEATGKPYANFTEWCQASEKNIEFSGDDKTGKMEDGLSFWKDPTDTEANKQRAAAVLSAYESLLANQNSTQVKATDIAAMKPLPSPQDLAKVNPPCFKSVRQCGSGNGCKRVGYSQLCTPCSAGEGCKTSEDGFTLPKLAKAPTSLSEDQTTTAGSRFVDPVKGPGSKAGGKNSASTTAIASVAVFASLVASAFAF